MLIKVFERRFIKDLEKAKKQNLDLTKLSVVVELLIQKKPLPLKYKNHKLLGDYIGHYECHIEPDWLFIYYVTKTKLNLF